MRQVRNTLALSKATLECEALDSLLPDIFKEHMSATKQDMNNVKDGLQNFLEAWEWVASETHGTLTTTRLPTAPNH